MVRYRESDFREVQHAEGVSAAWPISYADLEPWYGKAEQLFGVHGDTSPDPFDPPRSTPSPHGPVDNEPFIQQITDKVRALGLHPYPLPVAVDLHPGGKCRRCATCDGFPCPFGAKNDAETRCGEPALATGNVMMWTGALVRRLILDERTRRINAVEVEHRGEIKTIPAVVVVLSAGSINSPLILFRSALLTKRMVQLCGDRPFVIHLHDTRGLGIANAAAALSEGARAFDASLGGLGGCPFAPGATGNVVMEDLAFLCAETGFDTGINLEKLIAVRPIAEAALPNDPLRGAVAKAGLPRAA
jgi:choline dehydrogenase-like flavoprotein